MHEESQEAKLAHVLVCFSLINTNKNVVRCIPTGCKSHSSKHKVKAMTKITKRQMSDFIFRGCDI